ncbi:MAG: helix-turn-helix domain-containing protein [Terracidiphilus sp.]
MAFRLITDNCSPSTDFDEAGRENPVFAGSGGEHPRPGPRFEPAGDGAGHSKLSQSYLSQIESGARPHLTNTTRQILATFFKVHPGYLVDDPEGYHPELQSELRGLEDKLDLWLVAGAERFRRDPELMQALLTLARHERTRECLLLLESILETPGLMPRLTEVLRPKKQLSEIRDQGSESPKTRRGGNGGARK